MNFQLPSFYVTGPSRRFPTADLFSDDFQCRPRAANDNPLLPVESVGPSDEERFPPDGDRDGSEATVGEFRPGAWLKGTYHLEKCLAQGGMGQIFSATHARLPGLFAVKVLQPCFADDADLVSRFRREAEVMATLRHPHVVQVTDYDVSPLGRPYLVMEYLEGMDLSELLRRRGPLSCSLTAELVSQMAAALAAAHVQGVVHLDLKPENIMILGQEGTSPFVKVIDFGISKSRASVQPDGATLVGTPEYMSPEQIEGSLEGIDGRADQFSLAVMAFVLMTGHSPWGMDEPMTVLYRIVHEAPQSLGNYLSLPLRHVEAVLRRAMAKSPDARFPSITQFARALVDAAEQDDPAGAQVVAMERGLAPISPADLAHESTLLSLSPSSVSRDLAEHGRTKTGAVTRASRPRAERNERRHGRWAVRAAAVVAALGAWFCASSRVSLASHEIGQSAIGAAGDGAAAAQGTQNRR